MSDPETAAKLKGARLKIDKILLRMGKERDQLRQVKDLVEELWDESGEAAGYLRSARDSLDEAIDKLSERV